MNLELCILTNRFINLKGQSDKMITNIHVFIAGLSNGNNEQNVYQ